MTITAKVVTDSISDAGIRLTTMKLRYPRFIHAEFLTHRQFSRNASSSRAIPIQRIIEEVEKDPVIPVRWGRNGKGMQDHGEMSKSAQKVALDKWLMARDAAVMGAKHFLALSEVPHKQIVNRILEPFAHITVLVTATEWANFFALRRHPAAQPEIQILAEAMFQAMEASEPVSKKSGEWHLPFVYPYDVDDAIKYVRDDMPLLGSSFTMFEEMVTTVLRNTSVARCARVSYLKHNGTKATLDEEMALFMRLMGDNPKHASPAEHQGTPDYIEYQGPDNLLGWSAPELHANFVGWKQYRKMIVDESVEQNSRNVKEVPVGEDHVHI